MTYQVQFLRELLVHGFLEIVMEDKQIYTSARSEEVKRQILAFKRKVEQRLEKFKKDRNERSKAKTPPLKTPPRNVQEFSVKKDPSKPINNKSDDILTPRRSFIYTHKENIFEIVTYIIFGIIILFVALGIYLSYVKK